MLDQFQSIYYCNVIKIHADECLIKYVFSSRIQNATININDRINKIKCRIENDHVKFLKQQIFDDYVYQKYNNYTYFYVNKNIQILATLLYSLYPLQIL
jgi:hypothetical protein